ILRRRSGRARHHRLGSAAPPAAHARYLFGLHPPRQRGGRADRIFRADAQILDLAAGPRGIRTMTRLLTAAALCLLPLPAMAKAPVIGPATCETERAVYEMTAPDTDEVWRIGLVPARNM